MTELLLEWMSFRGTGRNDDLPASLTADTPVYRVVDDFSLLGHVEITSRTSWRVAPPCLAGLPDSEDQTAILCGARTPRVMSNLAAACKREGAEIAVTPVTGRPAVVRVNAPSKAVLVATARESGILLQNNAALTLLACTPAIRNWPRTPCSMVAGRVATVRRFSRSKVGWVVTTLAEAAAAKAGFFRIKRDWDWVSILKTGVNECAYIDDRAGRLAAVAKLKAAAWEPATRTFSLPNQLYPPATVARALALCTGSLPRFEARRIVFADIPPEILRLALTIMGLRLA